MNFIAVFMKFLEACMHACVAVAVLEKIVLPGDRRAITSPLLSRIFRLFGAPSRFIFNLIRKF